MKDEEIVNLLAGSRRLLSVKRMEKQMRTWETIGRVKRDGIYYALEGVVLYDPKKEKKK